jgi:hypothetical protein
MGTRSAPVLAVGGILSALGAFFFIVSLWRPMDGPALVQRANATPASRRLPVSPVLDPVPESIPEVE